jgi:thiamine pyrophosphate-dependent acetolactate synthase large subunit-like protein
MSDRRSFLSGIATAAAAAGAAATTPAEAAPAPAAPPAKLAPPSAVLAQAETGTPGATFTVDRWHVANPGSDYMVDIVKQLGYDYITCTPGSTFRGFQESITNYGGNAKPELLSSTHEEISAAMAHGYYKIAGKPMACIVHNTVGLQHASMAVYNAFADRVPMMIFTGNIADQATRRPGVEWYHTATDVATIVRGYIKYDTQPGSLRAWGEETYKAHAMSLTPVMGPVLVTIDGDLQEDPMGEHVPPLPKFSPVRASVADPAALAQVASALVKAQAPLIVADRMANSAAGIERLVALAETLQIPVIDQFSRLNFPSNHHLNQSFDYSLIRQADAILTLEPSDLFGIVEDVADLAVRTTSMRIKPGTVVMSISSVYNAGQGNFQDQGRFFEPTMAIAGDAEASLPYLIDAVNRAMTSERRAQNAQREAHFRDAYAKRVQANLEQAALAWDATPISTPRLMIEVWNLLKDDPTAWTYVSGMFAQGSWPHRLGGINDRRQWIGDASGAYGIGYNLPAATGAALAVRDQGRFAVNIQPDGDALMQPGSLWTQSHHKIPMLTVMHNNRAWHQEVMHLERMAARRDRDPVKARIGTLIDDPAIDYAKVAQGFGVYAEGPITQPGQLGPALTRALKVVKSGRPALVDVVCQGR